MHVLFVHRAFPAQFGRLGLELTRRYGWKCSFLIERLSGCPTPSPEMLQGLDLHYLPRPETPTRPGATPWPQTYGETVERARAVVEAVRARPGLRPDLVVGHGGLVPTLLLREVHDCPQVDYCEYYFAPRGRDLTYRVDLPPAEPAPFYPRCINATTLVNLTAADAGYAPTHWQRDCFPERFRHKIAVHFDVIDTELYRPRPVPRVLAGRPVPAGTRLVTFVARGLESMRGFDLFPEVADRVGRTRADVLFVVVGGEETYYGWDLHHTGGVSFKQWALARRPYDMSRFVFLGQVEPAELARVLCLSDLHVYLSVPFVLSWSLFNALACGCVVLAGDVAPVREVIVPDRHGLLEPLFDVDRLAAAAGRVLDDPAAFRPLGEAGRRLMEEQYGLDVAVPALKGFFDAAGGACPRAPGGRDESRRSP
jgi:glycosyltransferase involved in cell wall biosynthesis